MKVDNLKYACFIENNNDLKIILEKIEINKSIFIPLDLETFLLCKKNNLKIFDFKKFIKNEFHKKALLESRRFTKNLKFKNNISYSLKSEIIGYLRFRLHSILFLIEITEILTKKLKIKNLVVSGLKKNIHFLHNANISSEIIEKIYSKTVLSISDKNLKEATNDITSYSNKTENLELYKKIFISNGGYNFKKIYTFFKKRNYKVFLPSFDKINFFEKIIYFLRGMKVVYFVKDSNKIVKKENFIEKINFYYKNQYDISNLLNNFYEKLNIYFNDLNQKIISLKSFINQNNFDIVISNISRGLDGSVLDSDIKNPTLCVPHGVISKSFNEFDVIYKKIIAEAVFNGDSKFFAIQSKIMNDSLNTHKISGKPIITGNLIFSNLKYTRHNKKKYVLYATTVKGFTNLQYLGVDMFFEYWKILEELNEISKQTKKKIVVKTHPQFQKCTKDSSKYFKYLKFSNKRINDLLKHASSLITLSSGTIEDALNSKVPVILYDPSSRYKQMDCFDNQSKNEAVYYANNTKNLKDAIDKFEGNKKLNFDSYIYNYNIEDALKDNILPLLKNEKSN